MGKSKIEQDKAFWKAYFALEQTLEALNEAVQACGKGVIVRAVQLDGRILLLGTERGIEPPLSINTYSQGDTNE